MYDLPFAYVYVYIKVKKRKGKIDVELCRVCISSSESWFEQTKDQRGICINISWMEFGGNTRDLRSFGEETDEITDLHQILEEILLTGHGDGVASIKRRCRNPSSDSVRDLVTASGRGQLNEDLESST
ncbi:hypothetical protein Tco_0073977 [Tanacetum coccineum]